MNKNLIEVKNLTFKRGERVIYDNLNLKVQQGKNYGHHGAIRDRKNHATEINWRSVIS